MSFIVIKSSEDLKYLNKELLKKSYLGIDTEFRRKSKDNNILSLVQVNDGEETFLVDCILIGDYRGEASFIFSNKVTKIFHSSREDFEAIFSWSKEWPRNVFDTQLANAFLGGKYTVGYKDLVFSELGVSIDKDETRSNWVKRPLRDSQLSYAASDVQFLIELFHKQQEELVKEKKINWFKEQQLINERVFFSSEVVAREKPLLRVIKKDKEKKYLKILGKQIDFLSKKFNLNSTLLLSRKDQKEFLYTTLSCKIDSALNNLPLWKREILSTELYSLFEDEEGN